ncbi:VirB8/TrbF family protein [Burkholderia aenigmatica]|uniref:VirB8/TrbF family protein n=1 Tax=Burkholderia aenigmatica TaxID=2015348 RepID=UPI00264FD197|nr:VirB8/TrbF family protein [Burkholderia aenigmatica]MDN7880113.1 VirB8/TrbF family protein [Burkholderia aenigmatica]
MNIKTVLKSIVFKKPKDIVVSQAGEPSIGEASATPKAVPNPYLDARRAWNSHVGGIVSVNHVLVAVALISMFTVCGAVAGYIHLSKQSKFIPFIVRENELGEPTNGRPLTRRESADERELHAAVAKFITNARMVTPDAALQRKAVFNVYSMLSPEDPATKKMNEYLNGDDDANPFKRAEKVMVSTEIKTAIQQVPGTWQVDWEEALRDRQGVLLKPKYMMRALVTVYETELPPDATEQQVTENPHNIKVRDYSWAQQN